VTEFFPALTPPEKFYYQAKFKQGSVEIKIASTTILNVTLGYALESRPINLLKITNLLRQRIRKLFGIGACMRHGEYTQGRCDIHLNTMGMDGPSNVLCHSTKYSAGTPTEWQTSVKCAYRPIVVWLADVLPHVTPAEQNDSGSDVDEFVHEITSPCCVGEISPCNAQFGNHIKHSLTSTLIADDEFWRAYSTL